ncbi:MAG: manganese catalase family protein [Eubacteriales bacterium]|nr:manganese catalase family protein [Eubacteriales bacterium]
MWSYDKRLQFPVKIKNPDPQIAKIVMTQLGGPDGELGASMRYLNQRYAMPYKEGKAILTDIGTEELAHMEMISAIVYQLTRDLTPEQIREGGFDAYFVDHTAGIYPQFSSGTPWSAMTFQSKGDPITDLFEDLAAEQKARTTYDNLLRLIDDPDVREPLKFLREREIVHFQRFGDALRIVQDNLDAKNYYAFNPATDIRPPSRDRMRRNGLHRPAEGAAPPSAD